MKLREYHVEEATLAYLESLGYAVRYGPKIAPGEPAATRQDYAQEVAVTG